MHDLSLIYTIAAGFTVAWLFGLITQRLRMSPIVGYLLAGVVIGPFTPGFVGDVGIASQLAEIGVILLMFGVGMHFHVKDLIAVKNVAIPGAVVQSTFATLAAMVFFSWFGIDMTAGAVIGMAMAVASTVVLIRVLTDADVIHTTEGHVAVGWLIVEDIFTVVLLVLIPVLGTNLLIGAGGTTVETGTSISADQPDLLSTLLLALGKLVVLVVVVLWAGAKVIPRLLVKVAALRSRELFTLTVLVFSIAVAAASYFFFGASMALGAFLAGMVVAQSPVSSQAAADALPMRDAFAVLFFVSVGMLFDPMFLIQEPLLVLGALGIILIIKPLSALLIVAILGHPARTALTVALALAQIGEFSFILSELARAHGLMPAAGHNVLVASAIISITINPVLFRLLPHLESGLQRVPWLWKLLNGRAAKRAATIEVQQAVAVGGIVHQANQPSVIIVGYGPVGIAVLNAITESGLRGTVIDMNVNTVLELQKHGVSAVFGDASNERILEEAGLLSARCIVVTVPDASDRAAIITAIRTLSPDITIIARARYLREREELERQGVTATAFEEEEVADAVATLIITRIESRGAMF